LLQRSPALPGFFYERLAICQSIFTREFCFACVQLFIDKNMSRPYLSTLGFSLMALMAIAIGICTAEVQSATAPAMKTRFTLDPETKLGVMLCEDIDYGECHFTLADAAGAQGRSYALKRGESVRIKIPDKGVRFCQTMKAITDSTTWKTCKTEGLIFLPSGFTNVYLSKTKS
jgi:hypothetical protein